MNAVNPYNSPQSEVADPADNAVGEVRIFSARARIGRVRYLAYTVGIYLLVSLASSLMSGISMAALGPGLARAVNMAFTIAAVVGFLLYSFLPTIQRLHDFNTSGWLSLLTLVPFVNFIFFLVLLFIPGTDGRNRFGPKPPPNSTGVTVVSILASLFFFIALLGILAAIAIPAYQGYVHRAEQMQQQQTAPPPNRR